jgi:hypothetical protein
VAIVSWSCPRTSSNVKVVTGFASAVPQMLAMRIISDKIKNDFLNDVFAPP